MYRNTAATSAKKHYNLMQPPLLTLLIVWYKPYEYLGTWVNQVTF